MSVLKAENGKYIADGSYGQDWDSIIWVIGTWNMYLYNGDTEFLKNVYDISKESVKYLKKRHSPMSLAYFEALPVTVTALPHTLMFMLSTDKVVYFRMQARERAVRQLICIHCQQTVFIIKFIS